MIITLLGGLALRTLSGYAAGGSEAVVQERIARSWRTAFERISESPAPDTPRSNRARGTATPIGEFLLEPEEAIGLRNYMDEARGGCPKKLMEMLMQAPRRGLHAPG